MEKLQKLFASTYGVEPDSIVPLKGDGSDRRIYRIVFGGKSVIGVRGDCLEENVAFLAFSRHFHAQGLRVPEIYATNADLSAYLEEDLGEWTLFDWMMQLRAQYGFNDQIIEMYKASLEALPLFQVVAGESLDYGLCYQHAEFGHESMTWDLHYFKHRFLDVFYKARLDEAALERDFEMLQAHLLEEPRRYFLYRDFQSRNIMIKDGMPHFIDYQSGRRGALQYDVASLLYDAKANIPDDVREELIEFYLNRAGEFADIDGERFRNYFFGFVLIRMMQAFGAYGYLSVVKGKMHFFKSVPFALNNLDSLLQKKLPIVKKFKILNDVFHNLIEDESLRKASDASTSSCKNI